VEIVRLATEPHNGEDMVPLIREGLERVADWSDTDAVVAAWGQDANVRPMHPEVEWDASAIGVFGVAHGIYGLALFWARRAYGEPRRPGRGSSRRLASDSPLQLVER